MSHELLLLAGDAAEADRRRRRQVIEHAAAAVPNAVDATVRDLPHACLALVETAPPNGDVASVTDDEHGCRATVALTPDGVVAATTGSSRQVGSEAGHVTVAADRSGSLVVSTDGFATVGTYWATHRGELLLATHLASLVSLGLPAAVDAQGGAEYLAMLHPLGERTTLSGAALLQPGAKLRWDDHVIEVDATPIFAPGPDHGDTARAVSEFGDVWRTVIGSAIERADGDRALIGLSGGLDSRLVAAQWVRSGQRPVSYTYGDAGSFEARVATALAERLSLPHLRVPVGDADLLAGAESIAGMLDGAHAPSQMYELWFTDRLRTIGDTIANGLGGGTLMGDDKLMGVVGIDALTERAWNRYASDVAAVSPFVAADQRAHFGADVRASITSSFDGYADLGRADSGIYWRIANRQFRWGNMFHSALRRSGIRPETPFLDGRFLAYAARLTPEQRLNGTLYLAVQRTLFPEVADVARSDDGNCPTHLHHAYWSGDRSFAAQFVELGRRHPVAAARRGYRRAVGVAAANAAAVGPLAMASDRLRSRADVFPADVFLRRRAMYAERLASVVDAAAGTTDLLDDDAIDRATTAIRAGRPEHSAAAMGRVAALGAWAGDYRARAAAFDALASAAP